MGFHPPAGQFAIRLDIDDAALRQSLASAIEDRSGVYLADMGEEHAGMVVTDRTDGGEPDDRTIFVVAPGAVSRLAENTVLTIDADLAISAAHVVAAGYLVTAAAHKTGFDVPSTVPDQSIAFTRRRDHRRQRPRRTLPGKDLASGCPRFHPETRRRPD